MLFKRRQSGGPEVPHDSGEGRVRLSTRSLIALHHQARSLSLGRGRIRSTQSGGYLSPFKGRGMEFDEVRPYQQGDDVRMLDWRVTARTGRPHTKLYREERERSVLLCLDLRESMFFATQGAFKAVRAAQAAALLGWSAVDGGDRIGALIFDDHQHQESRPRGGRQSLLHLLNTLGSDERWRRRERGEAQPDESLLSALQRLRRVAPPGSLVFIFSDFAGMGREAISQLTELGRHCEVVLGFCHDPIESELPPAGRYRVSDGERSVVIDTADRDIRQRYHDAFTRQLQQLELLARRPGIQLLPIASGEEPLAALQQRFGMVR